MPFSPPAQSGRRTKDRKIVTVFIAVVLLASVATWLFWSVRKPVSSATGSNASAEGTRPGASLIPFVRFTDITREAGITFVHRNGAYGDKLLPETMGGGVAFFDFDSDGDQDLLFVNSSFWPWHPSEGEPKPTMGLFQNDGTGRFKDVTAGSGLDVSFYGMGVAVGDYDNDGRVDVFLTGVGGNRLFHNLGNGKFEDVTARFGLAGSPENWGTSAAWIDYDNDGDLDLFVCNYVQWSREIDFAANYRLPGIGRAYGPPMNFPGSFPYLYRNDGSNGFSDITREAGLEIRTPGTGVPMAKSLGVAPVDINNDQRIDLVVANDTVQNFVFTNSPSGTFKEVGAHSGIAFDVYGQTRGAMGIDAARFRNDEALGIAIGNFANEMNALYVSRKDALLFTDEAVAEGLGPASQRLLKFSLFFFDYDLDGRLDLLTANGHLEERINEVHQAQEYRQPAQLFWNSRASDGPRFIPVPPEKCGPDLFQPLVGRGSAFADIDGDGDLDVVLTQINGPPLLLRNDQKLPHSWLRIQLVGTRSNRDAIGAWIRVRAGNKTLSRQVMPTRGYLSQSELPVTIGLGRIKRPESVEIIWPNGRRQTVTDWKINALTVVTEPR